MNELEQRIALKKDFKLYARKCLKIRSKSGEILPFILNKSQEYIHAKIQEQLNKTGKVRVIVLKARQEGCSTYAEGRFYWLVTHKEGVRAFILTHDQEATNNLFEMAQRFHTNCDPLMRPSSGSQNAKEMDFNLLDSGYKVGTAGNKAVGRSSTIQFFHGSEVAFWPNATEHAKGVLQAIPNDKGTEIILESTANGIGNYFHEQWQMASRGESDYIPVFIPWFWQEEYALELPEEFRTTSEEMEIRDCYRLTNEQIYWRRKKIAELGLSGGDGERFFKQEYPCAAEEAFQTSGEDALIDSFSVIKARKTKCEPVGPLFIGVDPARFGADRTSVIQRMGRVASNLKSYSKLDTMQVTGIVHKLIKERKPDKVFIDVGGLGAGIVDRLREMGYYDIIVPVNGGESPLDADRYYNKRAEMWGEMKNWLQDVPCSIPDSDSLHSDLCAPTYKWDSKTRLVLEKKEDMKKRGYNSPDEGDALALTFSFPLRRKHIDVSSFINPSIRI